MEKLWGGCFEGQSEAWIETFGASISVDQKMAQEDITGSIAHVKMLSKTRILNEVEAAEIIRGLTQLEAKLHSGKLTFSEQHEDIHLNIEKLLYDEIGSLAGKMHTARSRNDQVATDMHLYLKNKVQEIIQEINLFKQILLDQAEINITTIMPGYTHLRHAQPISFAHHLLAYHAMLTRDAERLFESLKRIDRSPLGACALAGTTFPIDRAYTAGLLGFQDMYDNSLDAVSDRDFIVEFLNNGALVMMHLSRLAEEVILWTSYEFGFITLSDAYATGSSIMPQKKNPDMAELIRGKTGRVYGNLFSLLTTLKALPLAYNKDMQEDKEGMFDTAETVLDCLKIFSGMIKEMTVNQEVMAKSTQKDFSNATELADYLAKKGIPFRSAHEIVGKLVLDCTKRGIFLQDIALSEYQKISQLIEVDVYQALSSEEAVLKRCSYGGTGFEQIKETIVQLKNKG